MPKVHPGKSLSRGGEESRTDRSNGTEDKEDDSRKDDEDDESVSDDSLEVVVGEEVFGEEM